jgi:hypothetical protein
MIRKSIRQIAEWVIAAGIGFFIINLVCFGFDREPGWLDTPSGATPSIREPYSVLVHGKEGYGITRVDQNGYLNPDLPLADQYVLMLGASHTQGKEVAPDKKYPVLVNNSFGDDGRLHVYNVACDGSFLPSQIKYFKAALEAYPNAEAVTIEIYSTDYSVKALQKSLDQVQYDPKDTAKRFNNLSFKERVKILLKDYLPMVAKVNDNYKTIKKARDSSDEYTVDMDEYERVIDEALSIMRSETDRPIVFIYHPKMAFGQDGNIILNYSVTWDLFKAACERNGIDVIDSGDDFIEAYNTDHKAAYGFFNTTLGEGHINETGHRIIADEIIQYLEELQ